MGHRRRAAVVAAALAAVGLVGFVGRPGSDGATAPVASTTEVPPTTTTAPARPAPPPVPVAATVADARADTVALYLEPDVVDPDRPTMDNPTHEGLPVVFLVLEERGRWLRVQVSMRPNGHVRWVRRDEVRLRTVPNRIEVRLAQRELIVFREDRVLLREPVAIGAPSTPTPLGRFFVDGWVPLDGTGPYGRGQLSVAGFSDVLEEFGGGVGQIAVHGTNHPQGIGQAISNGCVRMADDALLRLVRLAPLGTPVDVVA